LNRNLLGILILLTVFAGNAFAANVVNSVTLENNATYTNQTTIDLALDVVWDGCDAGTKLMAFNCADSNGDLLAFNASHSLDLTDNVLYPACNATDGVKQIFAWIQCDYNGFANLSVSANNSITLDTVIPYSVINNNGQTQAHRTISFDVNDDLSGINPDSIVVKIDGTDSTVFNAGTHCTENPNDKNNFTCSYEETGILKAGAIAVQITEQDYAGNQTPQNASFTYTDTTAPAQVQNFSSSAGPEEIDLTWTANTEDDLNAYWVYYSTVDCTFDATNGTFAGTAAKTATGFTITGLNSGTTYYVKVFAEDRSGNKSATSDCETRQPSSATVPSAPTLTSSTHTTNVWTSADDVVISWAAVTNATGYSCTWGTAGDDPDGTIDGGYCANGTRQYQQDNVNNGTRYLKVKACSSDNVCSSASSFKVKIDDSTPDKPRNLDMDIQDNGDMELDWDQPSDLPVSGIKSYYVYRHTNDDFDTTDSRQIGSDNIADSFYDDHSSEVRDNKGTWYYYKVVAVSNSGRESSDSDEISAKWTDDGGDTDSSDSDGSSSSSSDASIDLDVPLFVGLGETDIVVSANKRLYSCYLRIKKFGESKNEQIDYFTSKQDFTGSYEFKKGDKGIAFVTVSCSNGDDSRYITVDDSVPSVEWIKPLDKSTANGTIELIAEAKDTDYGVDNVTFYRNGQKIAKVSSPSDGDEFRYNWNAENVSGEVTLKAVATDKGGNTAEAEIKIDVGENKTPAQENADAAIAKAEVAKAKVEALKAKFAAVNLPLPPVAAALKKQAEAKLALANNYAGRDDFANAKEKALEAEEKFNEVTARFGAPEEIIVKDFSFANEELEGLINGLLSNEEQAKLAAANLADAEAHRTLKVFKIKDGETEIYMIAVEVTVVNKTTGNTVKIIEVIPKELALTSDLIASVLPFEVIENDPIIEFKVNAAPGEKATISYGVNKALSKEEFDSMNSDGVFSSCNKPPLYFVQETVVGKESFSEKAIQAPIAFAGLGEFLPWIGGLIIIAVIAFIAFNVLKNREPKEPESLSPLASAASKHGGLGFGSFGRQSNKAPRAPKWGFKGE